MNCRICNQDIKDMEGSVVCHTACVEAAELEAAESKLTGPGHDLSEFYPEPSSESKPKPKTAQYLIDQGDDTPEPDPDKCQYCGAGRVVRPSGEWQFYCDCDDPEKRPSKSDLSAVHVAEPMEFIELVRTFLPPKKVFENIAITELSEQPGLLERLLHEACDRLESQAEELAAANKEIERLKERV